MGRQNQPSLENSLKLIPKLLWVVALLIAAFLPYFLINKVTIDSNKFVKNEKNEEIEFNTTQLLTQYPPSKTEEAPVKSSPDELSKAIIKAGGWVMEKTEPHDTLSAVFKRVGLSMGTLQEVLKNKQYKRFLTQIKPNQSIEFLIKDNQLQQMVLQIKGEKALAINLEKHHYQAKLITHKFDVVRAKAEKSSTIQATQNSVKKDIIEYRENYLTATVEYSLYNTAKRQKIPYKLIQQMIDILQWEVNFAKNVRGGDRFSIIYKAKYVNGEMESTGDIIAVTYTNRGVVHSALRHVSNSGQSDYYTPEGKSLKQAFLRYPVKFSRINSPFTISRMHPVLHYNRPHHGVDLAAPVGTPIKATGDGQIESVGYESGYGKVIKIAHNKSYTTVYAHLQRFAKGIYRGGYVKRGQIIGYVGKTGLATGPHCHYEFHVNHQPKNPSTVSLPHALPVPSRDLAAFKRHADRVIEHLKLFEEAHVSAKKSRVIG